MDLRAAHADLHLIRSSGERLRLGCDASAPGAMPTLEVVKNREVPAEPSNAHEVTFVTGTSITAVILPCPS